VSEANLVNATTGFVPSSMVVVRTMAAVRSGANSRRWRSWADKDMTADGWRAPQGVASHLGTRRTQRDDRVVVEHQSLHTEYWRPQDSGRCNRPQLHAGRARARTLPCAATWDQIIAKSPWVNGSLRR
jgi:hypothetical protein